MGIDVNKLSAFAGPAPEEHDDEGGEGVQEGAGKFGEAVPMLEEAAGEIEQAAQELECNPQEVLSGSPGEQIDEELVGKFHDGFEELDPEVQHAVSMLAGASSADCKQIAAHLQDEGMIENEDDVAAWLYIAATQVGGASDEELEDGEGGDDEGAGDVTELDEDGEEV